MSELIGFASEEQRNRQPENGVEASPLAWSIYDSTQDAEEFFSPERTIFQQQAIVHAESGLEEQTTRQAIFPYERWPGYVEQRAKELYEFSRSVARTMVSSDYNPERDIAEIITLEETFYRAVPSARPKEPKKGRVYRIALDVWRHNRLLQEIVNLTPEEAEKKKAQFDTNLHRALLTHLKENCHVHDHTTIFNSEEEKMVMKVLSNQPFEEVVALGVALMEQDDDVFPRREYEELKTVIAAGELLRFAPIGTRYLLISGPGKKYLLNYDDFGEIKETEEGERYLEVTRFKSSASYAKCRDVALQINPYYFDGYDPQVTDEASWYLGHLILLPESLLTSHQLYEKYIGRDPEAMDKRVFRNNVYPVCEKYIQRYENAIRRQASWREIREAYVLMVAAQQDAVDQLKMYKPRLEDYVYGPYAEYREVHYETRTGSLVQPKSDNFYLERGVQTQGAGCPGEVDDYGLGAEGKMDGRSFAEAHFGEGAAKRALGPSAMTNSELSDDMGSRRVRCPACGYKGDKNIRPRNGYLDGCKNPGNCPNRKAIVCKPDKPLTLPVYTGSTETLDRRNQEN